ncbi:MAG: TIR domain-containing protein [Planctomycetales bacterium]
MSIQPLLVHLLFHPESEAARDLARHVHRQLNDDAVVPGLQIPTLFCPTAPDGAPPPSLRLDRAGRNLVIPLADDDLLLDDRWCQFVATTWLACQHASQRCLPMQLTPNAWPLDPRLSGVNFGRAFAQTEGDERNAWVTRRVVIELCRFLANMNMSGDQSPAPVELFLSHAKQDINSEPRVVEALINSLKADQPVEAWVDSGEIETGKRFGDAIASGVKRTSLLAVLTDNYSSREWCREEVMLAKEHQRPIVVVDALTGQEVRSFPFLENVPKIRWQGSAAKCIDLLLKETLRLMYTGVLLEQIKQDKDITFLRPPEPATLLGLAPHSIVLYPDPPLGVGELRRLTQTNVTLTTPLDRAAQSPSLKGRVVALSLSESSDAARWGTDELHLTQAMQEISRHLLIRGATLAYGGHLGKEGYTQKLFEFVRTHNARDGVSPVECIVNHYGWPLPALSKAERAGYKDVATIVPLPRPDDVDEMLHPDLVPAISERFGGDKSAAHRYAWCRGMTQMRAFQVDRQRSGVVARIILGGKHEKTNKGSWYSSRMPGVLEEILLSIQAGQPVFLIGAFGGTARMVIDLLQGRKHPAASWEVQGQAPFAAEVRALYASRGKPWWYYDNEPRVEGLTTDDPRSIVEFLADAWKRRPDKGWETGINPLTTSENLELFDTVDTGRMVELLVRGLERVE